MILGIDFDQTIHDAAHPKEGRRMGEPLPGAAESLRRLKAKGHYILIHSCNRPSVIADWMRYYSIPYDSIWDGKGKPVCDIFVDDSAIGHESWEKTMTILESL